MTGFPAKFSEKMGPETPQQWNSLRVKKGLPNSFCHLVYFNHGNWGVWKIFPRTGRPRGPGGRGPFESKILVMRYPVNNSNRDWLRDNEGSDWSAGNTETRRFIVGMQLWFFVNTQLLYWEKARSDKAIRVRAVGCRGQIVPTPLRFTENEMA